MHFKIVLLVIVLMESALLSMAEERTINGKCYDQFQKNELPNVLIRNVHTGYVSSSDSDGNFSIKVDDEQLIEFVTLGYNTARIRMQPYITAQYYSIGLIKTPPPIKYEHSPKTFESDSTYWARYYQRELAFGKMSVTDWIYHPWEAFSKTSKRKWHLQATFKDYVDNGYINQFFNTDYISSHSKLMGDELQNFMLFYRPSIEFARSMTKYEFMSWIKAQAENYYQRLHFEKINNQ